VVPPAAVWLGSAAMAETLLQPPAAMVPQVVRAAAAGPVKAALPSAVTVAPRTAVSRALVVAVARAATSASRG
jgi:hypothetical protein